MIVCKYTKTENAVYVPHLDLLRGFTMAMRRKKIDVKFSDGFNPHARIFFNQPLPIGTASKSEYFCADSDEDPVRFMHELNESLQNGIKILKCARAETNPNVANMMCSADYTVHFESSVFKGADADAVMREKELIISYVSKGKEVSKDVRDRVLGLGFQGGDTAVMRLRCGNVNLRADRFADFLSGLYSACKVPYSAVKTAVYDKDGNNLDKVFFGD